MLAPLFRIQLQLQRSVPADSARAAVAAVPIGRSLLPVLVVAAVLAAGLDSPAGGTHPDEWLYLSLSTEMHDRGTWLTPTLEGVPDFTKPPLLYWASRVCLDVFGPHLWAARFPVALCALLLALLAGRLARRFGGEAAWARGVLFTGTCLGLLRYGRLTMMDVPLALALALGVEAAWSAVEERRPRLLLWIGLSAGLSALLKGPVGPILVVGIAAAILALREPALLRTRWAVGGLLLAVSVGAPWFVAMSALHGRPFLERFLVVEHLAKFTVPWTLVGEGWLLLSLLLLALPWVGLVRWRASPPGLRLLAGLWVLGVLAVFSLPGLKQTHYVVPCLVPVLLLAAVPRPRPGAARATAVLLGLLAGVALVGLRIPFPAATRVGLLGVAVILAVATVALWRSRPAVAAVGFAGAVVLTIGLVLPDLNPAPVPEAAWSAAGTRQVVVWRRDPGLFELSTGARVHRVNDAAETGAAVEAGAAAVLPVRVLEGLPSAVRSRLEPLARWSRLHPGIEWAAVADALVRADLGPLEEPMVLVVGKGGVGVW